MSALRPRVFRLQVVIIVVLALAVGLAVLGAAASTRSAWKTVHADKRLDARVSLDEELGVFLVTRGDRVIALANRGPWNNEPVDYCPSSQMFETGHSGSKFDLYGHYFAGPAPRGMSRYELKRDGDDLSIIPGQLIPGPRRSVSKRHLRAPVGPYCVPT